ncbi:major coat protein [Vibrio cincinnatiensis]
MFKNKKVQAAVMLAGMVVAGAASADIPPEAQAALDSVTSFADTIIGWIWGVGTSILVGFVGLKLVKKGANKAT